MTSVLKTKQQGTSDQWGRRWHAALERMVREDFMEEMTFEWRPEGQAVCAETHGRSALGRGSKHKGGGEGECWCV